MHQKSAKGEQSLFEGTGGGKKKKKKKKGKSDENPDDAPSDANKNKRESTSPITRYTYNIIRILLKNKIRHTVGRFLIVRFNDCILGKSVQIVNPIITKVDPILYYSIHACLRLRIC